jgi:hypothetical protein
MAHAFPFELAEFIAIYNRIQVVVINLPPFKIKREMATTPFKSKEGIHHHMIIRLEMATTSPF